MKRRPSPLVLASSATALSLLGDAMMYAVLPVYYTQLSLIPIHVGILLSANRWIRLLTNHFAGELCRSVRVDFLFGAALLLGAITTAAYGLVSSFTFLLLARVGWGVAWSVIRQAGLLTVGQSGDIQGVGGRTGIYYAISRMGALVGLFVGGIAHDAIGFSSTLLVFAAASVLAVPLGTLSRHGLSVVDQTPSKDATIGGSMGVMVGGLIVGLVGTGLIFSTLGAVLKERIGHDVSVFGVTLGIASLTGAVLAARWVIEALGATGIGRLADRVGRAKMTFWVFVAGSLALGSAAMIHNTVLLVCAVWGVFLCGMALRVLVASEGVERGGGGVMAFATGTDVGTATGPLLGWAMQQVSLPIPYIFVLGAVVYLIGAAAVPRIFDGSVSTRR